MLHCLDVFRRSLLRAGLQSTPPPPVRLWPRKWSGLRRVADKRRQQFVHCVSELREAGIRCRRHNTDRFWDIKFDNGVLQIPRILIHDGSKLLFLNLIAFEQCHMDIATPGGSNITSYAIFMDNLINSAEDVKYLHDRGIIEHWLGSDAEVADLFNRLCKEVVFDLNDSYLSGLSGQVNMYYDYKWSTWVATLQPTSGPVGDRLRRRCCVPAAAHHDAGLLQRLQLLPATPIMTDGYVLLLSIGIARSQSLIFSGLALCNSEFLVC